MASRAISRSRAAPHGKTVQALIEKMKDKDDANQFVSISTLVKNKKERNYRSIMSSTK